MPMLGFPARVRGLWICPRQFSLKWWWLLYNHLQHKWCLQGNRWYLLPLQTARWPICYHRVFRQWGVLCLDIYCIYILGQASICHWSYHTIILFICPFKILHMQNLAYEEFVGTNKKYYDIFDIGLIWSHALLCISECTKTSNEVKVLNHVPCLITSDYITTRKFSKTH